MQTDCHGIHAAAKDTRNLDVRQAFPRGQPQDLLVGVAEVVQRVHHYREVITVASSLLPLDRQGASRLLQPLRQPFVATYSPMLIADQIPGDTEHIRASIGRIRHVVEASPRNSKRLAEHVFCMRGVDTSSQAIPPHVVVGLVIDRSKTLCAIVHNIYMFPVAGTFRLTLEISSTQSRGGRRPVSGADHGLAAR